MTKRKHPPLFRYIEELHGDRPWGTLLDAGTGAQSIRWIADLGAKRWTAVTASPRDAERARAAIGAKQRADDRIVQGNWVDPDLLKGETFDTVIADYLLGAVEGYAPYFQTYLFHRLRPLTRGALYVKGLEPYVPTARPETTAGRLLWEIGRFRDACVLLGGDAPYREYPAPWVIDQLGRAGFVVRDAKTFAASYGERFVNAQIDLCAPALDTLADRALAGALRKRGEALRDKALEVVKAEGAIRHGRNYVIAAEPRDASR